MISNKKKLLINCDDLGYHPCINDAICEILSRGYIYSASLLATAPYFIHAVSGLKEIGIKEIGVHLALSSEYDKLPLRPILPVEEIKSVVSEDGKFYPEIQIIKNSLVANEVLAELAAQIEKIRSADFNITHLDGHMFFYDINEGGEIVFAAVKELAKIYKVPFRSRSCLSDSQIRKTYFIWETHETITAREQYYRELLNNEAACFGELIIHPGKNLDEMQKFTNAGLRRYADYQFFISKEFEELASDKVIGWREINSV